MVKVKKNSARSSVKAYDISAIENILKLWKAPVNIFTMQKPD